MRKSGEKRIASPKAARLGKGRHWTADAEREARAHNVARFVEKDAAGRRPGLQDTDAAAWRERLRDVIFSREGLPPDDATKVQQWRRKMRRKRSLLSGFLRPRGTDHRRKSLSESEAGWNDGALEGDANPLGIPIAFDPRDDNAGSVYLDKKGREVYVPPAFQAVLSPTEARRLAKNRARVKACRSGAAVEIEHCPCGSRYWIKFGCRSRLCGRCGHRYRAGKRQRFEPLARLHQEGEEAEQSLLFITLTWPGNFTTGPMAHRDDCPSQPSPYPGRPAQHGPCICIGERAANWETPADCNAWFRDRTRLLRQVLWQDAPQNWGMKGYLAVWETTAERTCSSCGLQRSRHDKAGKGIRAPEGVHPQDWTDKRGNLIRENSCEGWVAGRRTGKFHPHLHLLVYSKFIPIAQLRKHWMESGGGAQIRLEPARGRQAVDYVLKYLSKPWKGVPDDLQVCALYRTRRVTSVGEFYGARFRQLTARLMEPGEKTTTGIYCPVCNPLSKGHGPLCNHTMDGVELDAGSDGEHVLPEDPDNRPPISDLSPLEPDIPGVSPVIHRDSILAADRPVERSPQWKTVKVHGPRQLPSTAVPWTSQRGRGAFAAAAMALQLMILDPHDLERSKRENRPQRFTTAHVVTTTATDPAKPPGEPRLTAIKLPLPRAPLVRVAWNGLPLGVVEGRSKANSLGKDESPPPTDDIPF